MKYLILIFILISFNTHSSVRSFDDINRDMDNRKSLVCTHLGLSGNTYSVSIVNTNRTNISIIEIGDNLFGMDFVFIQKFNKFISRTKSIIDYSFNNNLDIQIGNLNEYNYDINIKTLKNQTIININNKGTNKSGELLISNFDDFMRCFKMVEYSMKNI